jgi:hypothetical protein
MHRPEKKIEREMKILQILPTNQFHENQCPGLI